MLLKIKSGLLLQMKDTYHSLHRYPYNWGTYNYNRNTPSGHGPAPLCSSQGLLHKQHSTYCGEHCYCASLYQQTSFCNLPLGTNCNNVMWAVSISFSLCDTDNIMFTQYHSWPLSFCDFGLYWLTSLLYKTVWDVGCLVHAWKIVGCTLVVDRLMCTSRVLWRAKLA